MRWAASWILLSISGLYCPIGVHKTLSQFYSPNSCHAYPSQHHHLLSWLSFTMKPVNKDHPGCTHKRSSKTGSCCSEVFWLCQNKKSFWCSEFVLSSGGRFLQVSLHLATGTILLEFDSVDAVVLHCGIIFLWLWCPKDLPESYRCPSHVQFLKWIYGPLDYLYIEVFILKWGQISRGCPSFVEVYLIRQVIS